MEMPLMSDAPLLIEVDQQRLTITLNRPSKRNALTRVMLNDLRDALRKYRTDRNVRLLLLQAAGSVFCAGMDLAEMQATAESPEADSLWKSDAEVYADVVTELLKFPAPTVAILNGPVLAGGVGLVLACDLVIGSETSSLSLPEPQRGIVAAVVTPLLNHRTSAGPASWMLLSQSPCTALQAHQWGLIHQLVSPDQLDSDRETLVQNILLGAPQALAKTKDHLREVANPALLQQVQEAAELSGVARKSPEAREGLAAFLEKRPPRWN